MGKKSDKPSGEGQKTYILDLKNGGTRRITIPSNWILTFGNLVPFQTRGSGDSGVALRLYEGSKDNLRGVMTDVKGIRDTSIHIEEKRTSVQRKSMQKNTAKGAKDFVVEARMTAWVNPDDDDDDAPVPEEFLKLPSPADEEE